MSAVVQALIDADKTFDLIVTSPLIRTVQTAEIWSELTGTQVVRDDRLRPGGSPCEILDDGTLGRQCIALVGHNPSLSTLVTECLWASCADTPEPFVAAPFRMKKAMFVEFERLDSTTVKLAAILEPHGPSWLYRC